MALWVKCQNYWIPIGCSIECSRLKDQIRLKTTSASKTNAEELLGCFDFAVYVNRRRASTKRRTPGNYSVGWTTNNSNRAVNTFAAPQDSARTGCYRLARWRLTLAATHGFGKNRMPPACPWRLTLAATQDSARAPGCHRLARWRLTFAATQDSARAPGCHRLARWRLTFIAAFTACCNDSLPGSP